MENILMRALFCLLIVFCSSWCAAAEPVWPAEEWRKADASEADVDRAQLERARDYALTSDGAGLVIVGGKEVISWGNRRERYDLKSTTKSFGSTALGIALLDGKVRLSDPAIKYQPELGIPPESNRSTGWLEKITLKHLASQTAGFEKPGGYGKLLFEPGTKWFYSDAGPNWLAECLTLAYRRDMRELMFERVFTPLGIRETDLTWRNNQYRSHQIDGIPRREFGSGIHANVDAMARIGYLYLRSGRWRDRQILSPDFVPLATRTPADVQGLPVQEGDPHKKASHHYGLLWWNNGDGALANVPKDTFWSWGLYDSLIVVMPSLDLVAARAGPAKSWKRSSEDHYAVLAPFLGPLAAAVTSGKSGSIAAAPYPPSSIITGIAWSPPESIVRMAKGSDNWPMTWGDDDRQYTAYGDGWGFEPRVERKLSIGLCAVSGTPPEIKGVNIRSSDVEFTGDGKKGEKASGMLMVRGVLYMWLRNADNSRLVWSTDRGATWQSADWKFTSSFGCPTFLNFGRNYAQARDEYVYVYSHDADSAYDPADRMVLARVPADRIADRDAYEFFERRDADGRPVWTKDIARRGAVFEHAGLCYRSGISYNAGLKRYLWCHTIPRGDARFAGGFAIYDAPEPWGPWTTVYFTRQWDVGPGETSSFPTKWISADGRTLHLVFSGDDCFSVRRAMLRLADDR
jgi:CubicO group peptidase (beta-lactamase class C family)